MSELSSYVLSLDKAGLIAFIAGMLVGLEVSDETLDRFLTADEVPRPGA